MLSIYGKSGSSSVSMNLFGVHGFDVSDQRNISTKKIQDGTTISDHVSKQPTTITVKFTVGDIIAENRTGEGFVGSNQKSWFDTQLGGMALTIGRKVVDKAVDKVISPETQRKIANGYVVANGLYEMTVEQIEFFNSIPQERTAIDDSNWYTISQYPKSMRNILSQLENDSNKNIIYTIQSRRFGAYKNYLLKSIQYSEMKNSVGGFECTLTFQRIQFGSVGKNTNYASKSPTGGSGGDSTNIGGKYIDKEVLKPRVSAAQAIGGVTEEDLE